MQGKNLLSNSPIRYIKGVGPQMSLLFEKIAVETISDLLYYLPRRYEDRTTIREIKDVIPGESQGVIGNVLKTHIFTARTGTSIYEIEIGDETKNLHAVWYNLPFMSKVFSKGQKVVLYGRCEYQRRLEMIHPVYEILDEKEEKASLDIGRIVPFYPLTENLSQKYLRKIVYRALDACVKGIKDPLPTQIRARHKLVDTQFAVENIHFPYSFDNLEKAYRRLVFEEFFVLQVIMALRRKRIQNKGIKHEIKEGLFADFEKLFNFKLTGDQKKCIKEIEKDMSSQKSMYRLLQGDVSSGKTVVAMYALLLTVENGYQAAMMVPTEVLARQHYMTLSETFMPLGIDVRLLTGSMGPKDREKVKREIMEGEADIVVGTHALIQEGIAYKNLGLVVVDEQHKFGVMQRKELRKKGGMPDTLVMTATPIPQSLVMTVFGDMDISVLKEKPADRIPVATYSVGEDKRRAIYEFIRDQIQQGRQAFIVCPRIKMSGLSDLASAEDIYARLRKDVFKKEKLALIHGRMKTEEKERVMTDFCDGKYDILVATTVIEVGLDIPNV
ncbi:MAG: ATP-dependent DNA helicase RecG, partial [Candidatus Omnitrophica bacterium]|nr:ATP-dependent DNA helicase RecG [Candidatus Omnitrophota bacterium]